MPRTKTKPDEEEAPPLPERLWETKDVAQFLHLGETSIWALRQKEGLPSITLLGSVRFDPRDVARWLEHKKKCVVQ